MTPAFVVRVTAAFERWLKKLSPRHPGLVDHYAEVLAALQDDLQNRRNTHNIKKVGPKRYRIRIGRWRFLYTYGRPGGVVDLLRAPTRGHVSVMTPDSRSWEKSLFSAWATRLSETAQGHVETSTTGHR